MPARPLAVVVVALVAVVLALLYFSRVTDLPGDARPDDQGTASATAATGTRSTASAAEGETQGATTGEGAARVAVEDAGAGPSYAVRGRMLGKRGVAVAGAEVLAFRGRAGEEQSLFAVMSMADRSKATEETDLPWATSGDPIARTTVAADGSFAFETRERHLRLRVLHDLYGLAMPEIVHADANTRQAYVVLDPYLGGCVRGRLVGEATGPFEARLVPEPDPMSASKDPMQYVGAMLSAASAPPLAVADGSFVARAVLAGSPFVVTATATDAAAKQRQPALLPGEVREVALPWTHTTAVAVRVVGENGAPLAGARVRATEKGAASTTIPTPNSMATTGDDGRCELASLVPGDYAITASMRNRVDAQGEATLPSARPIELLLRRGGSVSGVVVDHDGKPIAGAHVMPIEAITVPLLGDLTTIMGLDLLARAAESGSETDAEGHFVCHGIDGEAPFHVVAAHERHAPGIQNDVTNGAADLRIVLLDTASLDATVLDDASGEPIGEFSVALRQRMFLFVERDVKKQSFDAETKGRAHLAPVDAGDYSLVATADGYSEASASVHVEAGAKATVAPLRLRRAARVSGRVIDDAGRPVAGALVQRARGGLADNPAMAMLQGTAARTRTDESGAFVLTGLPAGKVSLLASAEGFANATSARLELKPGDQLDGIEIALGHGGTIEGRLLVADGEHAEDFTLMVQSQTTQKSGGASIAADGTFRVTDLEPGAWQVQAMHPAAMRAATQNSRTDARPGRSLDIGKMMSQITENTVSQHCTVRQGEVAEVELDARELGSGVRLELELRVGDELLDTGIVEATQVDDGAIRAGFVEKGRTSFAAMKPGTVRVQVRAGLTMAPVGDAITLEIPTGTDRFRHAIALPAGELGGRVVDAETGEALPFVLVRLLHGQDANDAADHGTAITQQDGTFAFRGLAPGRYGLVAADALMQRTETGAASRLDDIDLASGQRRTDLVLRAQPAAGLAVRVVDEQGAPVPGAILLAVDDEGRSLGSFATAVSSGDGRAHLGGVPQGRVRVVGRAPGRAPDASAAVDSQPGRSQSVELVLRRGTRVVLDARDRHGASLRSYDVRARCNGGPWFPALLLLEGRGDGGTSELGRLAPGEWEFAVTHPTAGSFSVRRTIADGPTVTIVAAPGG